ncbi:hypothetical protein NUU61_001384 [Penicillium alfredii]|uniref:Ricin B lectin domain-containing protein n=1 Tax=Penicillium alfredii TaxID=1506179 RepID=A0A9W9G487_9EURO|nr:uncharacterized protein NUU61_001384 [Penicillium alfredii]KAJ5111754.1 hypothetical protein NUU61_001384 [Penicillium alfredii]
MWTQLIRLIAGALPMAMAMATAPNHPLLVTQDTTLPVAIPDITDKVIDLADWFNGVGALNNIDNILQHMSTRPMRRFGVKLAWMPWGSVPSPVKPRATMPHADTDPVIRASIDVNVNNTPGWCVDGVDGSVIYYIFPDNTGYLIDGTVDSWDTLTDNNDACNWIVNDQLRKDVPKLIPMVQRDLIHPIFYSFHLGEHFGSYYLLPQWTGHVVDPADVQLVLQRDTIVSRWNNLCMAVQDYTSGGLVQQAACNNGLEQKYEKFPFYSPRIFSIRNLSSGMCLGISEGSTANGALIAQYPCDPSDKNQQWESVDPGVGNEVGAKWLINLQSGKCVDVPAWSTTPGTLLQQLDCIGGWKDYWYNV